MIFALVVLVLLPELFFECPFLSFHPFDFGEATLILFIESPYNNACEDEKSTPGKKLCKDVEGFLTLKEGQRKKQRRDDQLPG